MGEECRIGGEQVQHPAQQIRVHSEPRQQQIAIIGALVIDFEVGDDLSLAFLNLYHLAKLGRPGGFAFADDAGQTTKVRNRSQPTGLLELQGADAGSSTFQDLCRATRHDNDRDTVTTPDSCQNSDDDGGGAPLTNAEIKK
jgi:hypothetical protein